MEEKTKKQAKFSWQKYLKISLRIFTLLSIVIIWFGAMSTQSQESANEQLFFDSRIVNGFGALFLLVAWGFWEWYIGANNKRELWKFITVILLLLAAVITINGLVGIIAGALALVFITITYLLDFYKIISIGREQ